MKQIIIIILFSLGIANIAFSQVPGFLGKRFSVSFSSHLSPVVWSGDIVSVDESKKKSIKINRRFSIGVDYVLGRHWSVSTNFHIQNTATNQLMFDDNLATRDLGYGIKSNGYSIQFLRFQSRNSDFLAPVGRYFSFGYMASNFTLIDVEGHSYAKGTEMAKGSASGLSMGFGRKRIIAQRFIIDYAIEFAWLFYLRPPEEEPDFGEFIYQTKRRIVQSSAINIKLGIGYLF